MQSYLDEFVFRFNRRPNRHAGLRSLLNLAMKSKPMTYKMLTQVQHFRHTQSRKVLIYNAFTTRENPFWYYIL